MAEAPPGIALAPAKELRARAARAADRAAPGGSARGRFLREQRRRLTVRLVPTLGLLALAAGAAALGDVVGAASSASARTSTLAEGGMAMALAAITISAVVARRHVGALYAAVVAGALVHVAGWSLVQHATGGAKSPYALAVPFGVAMIAVIVPTPWQLALVITGSGVIATVLAAPGAPLPAYVVFVALFVGSVVLARQRRRRELATFRRVRRVARSVAKLRRMQDELVVVEKLEALRVLVGGMAHELNNALAVSAAWTERVKASAGDAEATRAAADKVGASLARIRGTIERLHRFATADEQVLAPADVGALVDFALESAVGRARSGVVVERDYEEGLAPVSCNAAALAEALAQIAKNAVESMPAGGTIRVGIRREGDVVLVSVADEGRGIPKERLARVFDPFFAREEPETLSGGRALPSVPGRPGLGLSTVYGIVRAMGGEVRIESEVGQGTRVTLVLPHAAEA